MQRTEKLAKTDPKMKVELDTLISCKKHLDEGKNIITLELSKEDKSAISDLFLLTDKHILYVANVDEASMHTGNKYSAALIEAVKNEGNEVIVMTNAIEAQIAEFESIEDKGMFMEEYKMLEPAMKFARKYTGKKGMVAMKGSYHGKTGRGNH